MRVVASIPPILGIMRSISTTLMLVRHLRHSATASSPFDTALTRYPARCSRRTINIWLSMLSSATSTCRGSCAARPGETPGDCGSATSTRGDSGTGAAVGGLSGAAPVPQHHSSPARPCSGSASSDSRAAKKSDRCTGRRIDRVRRNCHGGQSPTPPSPSVSLPRSLSSASSSSSQTGGIHEPSSRTPPPPPLSSLPSTCNAAIDRYGSRTRFDGIDRLATISAEFSPITTSMERCSDDARLPGSAPLAAVLFERTRDDDACVADEPASGAVAPSDGRATKAG
mmetsp:Transcript_16018/g.50057  ORF Transcript_16018/g.50057 Transcript_16018/m.50057 type:complete len:283 (-) Transcript_16018:941-1789(-)